MDKTLRPKNRPSIEKNTPVRQGSEPENPTAWLMRF
jgi:hypothetical protein